MNVFMSERRSLGRISETEFHWVEGEDLVMPSIFKSGKKSALVSVHSLQSRKGTTFIQVRDLDIPRYFYYELIKASTEDALECEVADDGTFSVMLGARGLPFNLNDIVDQLLRDAAQFEDGDRVRRYRNEYYRVRKYGQVQRDRQTAL